MMALRCWLRAASNLPSSVSSRPPYTCSDRGGNNVNGVNDFCLQANGRIWAGLSYVCRVCSTCEMPRCMSLEGYSGYETRRESEVVGGCVRTDLARPSQKRTHGGHVAPDP